jgi:hypothetical protein
MAVPNSQANLERLAGYCSEFLVHGVDVEGKRIGILVRTWCCIPKMCRDSHKRH